MDVLVACLLFGAVVVGLAAAIIEHSLVGLAVALGFAAFFVARVF